MTYHREWSMLIQAAWTCGIYECGLIFFGLLPQISIKIFGKESYIPVKIFITCYAICTCIVLPTVHFIYSKKSRNIIKHDLYHFLRSKIGEKNKIVIQNTIS